MNRSKLLLIELTIMIAVFAAFSAVCVQLFASAKHMSEDSAGLRQATEWVQSAAECYHATGGDLTEVAEILGLEKYPDGSIQSPIVSDNRSSYHLTISPLSSPGAPRSSISVTKDGTVLLSITVTVVQHDE